MFGTASGSDTPGIDILAGFLTRTSRAMEAVAKQQRLFTVKTTQPIGAVVPMKGLQPFASTRSPNGNIT